MTFMLFESLGLGGWGSLLRIFETIKVSLGTDEERAADGCGGGHDAGVELIDGGFLEGAAGDDDGGVAAFRAEEELAVGGEGRGAGVAAGAFAEEEIAVFGVDGGDEAWVGDEEDEASGDDWRGAGGDVFGLFPEELAGEVAGGGACDGEGLEIGFTVAGVDGEGAVDPCGERGVREALVGGAPEFAAGVRVVGDGGFAAGADDLGFAVWLDEERGGVGFAVVAVVDGFAVGSEVTEFGIAVGAPDGCSGFLVEGAEILDVDPVHG